MDIEKDGSARRLAVLIDADNAQASVLGELLAEASKYGTLNIKRAYGDWTGTHLKSWKEHLHKYAIAPIQQFSYTAGKNATDSALIIDAMDLLHRAPVDGFCLVSSDSDFTRLATRIRESGLVVYGFGETKTPEAFVVACDKFIYTEILRHDVRRDSGWGESILNSDRADSLQRILQAAIIATMREDDWSLLSAIGLYISKNHPAFDPRNYGYEKLGQLIKACDFVDIRREPFRDGSSNMHILVRLKNGF
ncbi:MAG: NYN domain-containing protein [Wolinella sp.]